MRGSIAELKRSSGSCGIAGGGVNTLAVEPAGSREAAAAVCGSEAAGRHTASAAVTYKSSVSVSFMCGNGGICAPGICPTVEPTEWNCCGMEVW